MTFSADTVRTLADLEGPERAFLSVYLSRPEDAGALGPRFERLRSLVADRPAEAEYLEENLGLLADRLASPSVPPEGGLALFACWALDWVGAIELPEPAGPLARVGDAPYLRPLAEQLDEHETFAVAAVDATRARVYLVTADDWEREASVRGDVKNRVKKGGWSQKRYARRRDKQMERYAADVAEQLGALRDEHPFERLVLVGSDEAMHAVRDALPTGLAEAVVGERAVDLDESEPEVIAEAAEVASAAERDDEESLWEAIREQALAHELAAFGPSRVLPAVEQGRVEALLVTRDAEIAGTKCRACGATMHGTPETCGVCGSADVFRVDLVEALVERAARTGAEVDFADPFPALAEAGDVAALLRW